MLRLWDTGLHPDALGKLAQYQGEVDGAGDYAARVAVAKVRFGSRNRGSNTTFRAVREALARMVGQAVRCAYCEDSAADEVEHIRPKDLYPGDVFCWPNYVYACGACNGRKSNRFSVIDTTNMLIDVTRTRKAPVVAPMTGRQAMIDPRTEEPLRFFDMDLRDTFYILEALDLDPVDEARAKFTIELLGLNRELLLTVRRDAYIGYRSRLREYAVKATEGADQTQLNALRDSLLQIPHPTVWEEMKRQADYIDELTELFTLVPAAMDWQRFSAACVH